MAQAPVLPVWQRASLPRGKPGAHFDGHQCALLAHYCGAKLLQEVDGANSAPIFDATVEHASRLYDVVCLPDVDDTTPCYRRSHQVAQGRRSPCSVASGSPPAMGDSAPSSPLLQRTSRTRSGSVSSSRSLEALMTRASFARALEHEGFTGLEDEPAFFRLWESLGQEALTLSAFHALLRHLKLHVLCGALPTRSADSSLPALEPALEPEDGFVGFVDWCPRKYVDCYFAPPTRPLEFFLTHRAPEMRMRWVHCAGVARPTILRLAVKYQLHPLPVDDTIRLEQQSLPLVRKYGGNFFVVIPLLRLTRESKQTLGLHRRARRDLVDGATSVRSTRSRNSNRSVACAAVADDGAEARLPCLPQVEQCRLALFAAGPPLYDTVISVRTAWRTSRLHGEGHEDLGASGRGPAAAGGAAAGPLAGGAMEKEHSQDTNEGDSGGPATADAFDDVAREIKRDFSMLRAGNASWVLWRILDASIDELTPILAAYRAQLRWFAGHIVQEDAGISEDVEKHLLRSKSELDWLQRKMRPTARVLKHLIQDKEIDPAVTRYMEDVEDHLMTFVEEVGRMVNVFNSLRDEVMTYRTRRQQNVLYVLTLVTIMVMPTHLLTGLYGMNFQDASGAPVVPGLGPLRESRGYLLFWGLSLAMTASIYLTFSRVLGWI